MSEFYTIVQGDNKNRKWSHFVEDEDGKTVAQYEDNRDISSSNSHEVVATACMKLNLPEPKWIEHDEGFIHFGYKKPSEG